MSPKKRRRGGGQDALALDYETSLTYPIVTGKMIRSLFFLTNLSSPFFSPPSLSLHPSPNHGWQYCISPVVLKPAHLQAPCWPPPHPTPLHPSVARASTP